MGEAARGEPPQGGGRAGDGGGGGQALTLPELSRGSQLSRGHEIQQTKNKSAV